MCNTAYGRLYPICRRSVIWWWSSSAIRSLTGKYWVQHTISCITQSNAPEDGQNCCPKHVELNWIYQLIVISLDFFFTSLLMMHGKTNIKFIKTL
jgi:hypothetical protein